MTFDWGKFFLFLTVLSFFLVICCVFVSIWTTETFSLKVLYSGGGFALLGAFFLVLAMIATPEK